VHSHTTAATIRNLVTPSGNSGHISVPAQWSREQIFVKKLGKTDKKNELIID
jgi:hypothetical protein